MKKFLFAAAMGLTAMTATPALAQAYQGTPPPEGYYNDGYAGDEGYYESDDQGGYYDQGDYRQNGYDPRYDQRYAQQGPRRYQPGDYYQGGGQYQNGYQGSVQVTYSDRGYAYGDGRRYRGQRRCGSTGTIIGGVAGALIGGEIGRGGGRYSRRSGTGTVIGAGVGALIGNGIDRDNCYDQGRGPRRYRR